MIQWTIKTEIEEETRRHTATATRNNLSACGSSYDMATAKAKAVANLINLENNLGPKTPNWENSELSFYANNCYFN